MEKKELTLINGKKVTIMEQPTSFILNLEKKYSVKRLAEKCREILKYPSGVNPTIDELVDFPVVLTVGEREVSLISKEGNTYDWNLIQAIMNTFGSTEQPLFSTVGEFLVKRADLKVDDFKYKELKAIGEKTISELADYVIFAQVNECFNGF